MATLILTPGTHISDLLDAHPEAESILGWYGDKPMRGEHRTLAQFASSCGMEVGELLIDLRASLALSSSASGEEYAEWDDEYQVEYEPSATTVEAPR